MILCNNSLFLPRLYLHTYDIISRTQRNLVIHYHIELLLGSGIFFSSSEKLIPLSTVHHSWCNLRVGLHACRDPICTDAYVFLININVSPFRWRQQYVHMDDKNLEEIQNATAIELKKNWNELKRNLKRIEIKKIKKSK